MGERDKDNLIPEYKVHKRPRIRWIQFIKYLFGVKSNVRRKRTTKNN